MHSKKNYVWKVLFFWKSPKNLRVLWFQKVLKIIELIKQKVKSFLKKGATIATLNSDTREAMPCFREVLESIGTNHFNTLKHLMIHLQKVAQRSKDTGMSSKNLAIVWAPNLIKTSLSTHGMFIE